MIACIISMRSHFVELIWSWSHLVSSFYFKIANRKSPEDREVEEGEEDDEEKEEDEHEEEYDGEDSMEEVVEYW